MKRFTETQKWSDPWFRKLKPETKNLWQWLCDNCDPAGVIDPDMELASFQIGYQYPLDTLSELGDRIVKLPCGKFLLVKFVVFQYGERLSRDCKAHNPVFQSLEKHGIESHLEGYPKGIHTPQAKVKVKVKVKETAKVTGDEIYSPESRAALHWLNEKSGKHFRECQSSLEPIHARLKESGVDIDGVKKMIERQCRKWKGSNMEEYLRPQTLFGKEKFDGYYASREAQIIEEKPNGQPAKPRKMTDAEILRAAM